jgi:hypothetical protein
MKQSIIAALITLAVVSSTAHRLFASGPATLIANGSFELPTVIGSDQEFGAPSTAITGWQISAGSVDVVGSGTILGSAHSGLQMIDINGSSAGAIEQSFATVPGNRYRLELFYSNNPNPASALPSYSASVSLVGTTQLLNALVTHAGATEFDMNWLPFARSFTADSTMTRLVLSSGQGGYNGIYFDAVSVIPEPSHVAMLASIGMASTFWFSRRLRRPQVREGA